MKKRFMALVLSGMLLFLTGCVKSNPEVQELALPEDNPIDKAFARIAEEHKSELENNVIFSYLYALKWHDELDDLRTVFGDELLYDIDNPYDTLSAAYEYGKAKADSGGLVAHFEGIARFYKMLVLDYLKQLQETGINAGFRANEDKIYNYLNTINYTGNDDYHNFEIVSWLNDGRVPDPMPAIAGVDGEDIFFLYSEFGAVLSVKGEQRLFRWDYMTPRAILPRLALADFNGDGVEELAAILYNGSGTGLAVEELHIVNLTYFFDSLITSREIKDELGSRFSADYEPDQNKVVVKLDEQTIHVDVSEIPKEINPDFGRAGFDSIIGFDEHDGTLSVHITVGLYGFDWVIPFDYVDFYADLAFDKSFNVRLSNCRIQYRPMIE